jgi:hypothetical protein
MQLGERVKVHRLTDLHFGNDPFNGFQISIVFSVLLPINWLFISKATLNKRP